jgi:hypothetical protein
LAARLRFDAREPGSEIDPEAIAANDILALGDHHIPDQGDRIGRHVVDALVADRGILALGHDDAARCFETADLLIGAGCRG